jgi:hypothetical protein
MAEYDSPLGRKKVSGSGMREFNVPDESKYEMPDMNAIQNFTSRMQQNSEENSEELSFAEQEIRAAREARRTGKERLNDGAKRRIEMLLGMTRLNRSCELDGNEYVLQTLKSKDLREVYTVASEFDGTINFPYEVRRQTIARSLIHVGGLDIEQFVGSTSLESKLSFIDELPEALLQRLFDEYQLLVKESDNKYSIKTEEDAKELVEDLKK